MTEFKIKPVKEVIITDLIQDELENFLYICRINNVSSTIWVEGMIILLVHAIMTEKNVERQFEGYRMYEKVVFVKYPKYTKTVKWNGGNFEIALQNYTSIPRFQEFAKWIKSQQIWETIPERTT